MLGERDHLIMNTVPRYAAPLDRVLMLTASATMFEVSLAGAPTPASITFSALMLGAVGAITFSSEPAVPLTVANGDAVLSYADMSASIVTVTASTVIEGITYLARQTVAKQQALDLTPPPAPTGLAATGHPATITLAWDAAPANYKNLSHTEVWRAPVNNFAQAVLAGRADGREYTDPVGPGAFRYYWIRYVSRAAIPGPYNASSGTVGASDVEVEHLLQVLEGEIRESQLYADLGAKIDLIEPMGNRVDDLEQVYGDTVDAATSAGAAAQSAADAIAASVAADLAKAAAAASAGGAGQYATQSAQSATNANTSAGTASTAAQQSAQSATNANGSAGAAASSASTAAGAAGAAGQSASAASTSQAAAAGSVTAAGVAATASNEAKLSAQAARDEAGTAAGAALTSSGVATAAATAAGDSASAAAQSAITATTKAGAASASAGSAATSETNAGSSASAAAQSAQLAAQSRDAAGGSAEAAAGSASTAAAKSTAAEQSAAAASAAAVTASSASAAAAQSAGDAGYVAGQAGLAAQNAGGSAAAAAQSASSANTKSTEAAQSAAAANSARIAAEAAYGQANGAALAAAGSASTADARATAAGQSAAAASNAATTAGTAAGQAGSYLQQVAQSATNADGSAQAAASYVQQAQAILTNPITGLQASYAAVKVLADATVNSLSGVQAKYSVQLDADGVAGGFELIAGGGRLDFGVRASTFFIAAPAGSGIASSVPFIVRTTETVIGGVTIPIGVYIANAFIQNASITNAKIGGDIWSSNYSPGQAGWYLNRSGDMEINNLRARGFIAGGAFTHWAWPENGGTGFYLGPEGMLLGNQNTGKFAILFANGDIQTPYLTMTSEGAKYSGALSGATGTFSGNVLTGSGSGFRVEMGPDDPVYAMWAGAGAKNDTNAIFYLKRSGAGYFGGSLSAGTLKTAVTNPELNPDAQLVDGPFGSNGGAINVVCSLSWLYIRASTRDRYTAGAGTNTATITLYRKIGDGAEQVVQSGTFSGPTEIVNTLASEEKSTCQQSIQGSFTYTDTAGSTANRTYRAVLSLAMQSISVDARPGGTGSADQDSAYQRLTIITTE